MTALDLTPGSQRRWMLFALLAAACSPSLLAYNISPSPTLLNQLLALALWGAVAAAGARIAEACIPLRQVMRDAGSLLAALAALMVAVLWSWLPGSLPSGLALSALGLLGAAAVLLFAGVSVRAAPQALPVFMLFCLAWVTAGVLNASIAMVQVFAPGWPDGLWLARSGVVGRAVGNLRQPNHLSSLLLWAAIALVPLLELGRLRRAAGALLMTLMIFAVLLSASRTGGVGVLLLALWGACDRRLSRPTRALLLATPLIYALAWAGMAAWAHLGEHAFGVERRLAESDLSGSRLAIWSDTLALIGQHPWTGVGFGEFNLAWSLTPFPARPTAFFDHTHNLPLQLAVELGLPLAALVLALSVLALWQAWQRGCVADAAGAVSLRSAWVMLLMIGLHSLLEYPLWYAYFLLPTAWLFGFCLGRPAQARSAPGATRPLLVAGLLLVIGSALALVDYVRVALIFLPPSAASPLAARIADGRRSVLFAHHADYASVTTGEALDDTAFTLAPHYLMDTRLMIAWSRALAAAGETEKARHLVQRLREFRNPASDEFFAACDAGATPVPFQCQAPASTAAWRDYLR